MAINIQKENVQLHLKMPKTLHEAVEKVVTKLVPERDDLEMLEILFKAHGTKIDGKIFELEFNTYDSEGNSPLSLALLNYGERFYEKLFDKDPWRNQRKSWLNILFDETDLYHPNSNHLFVAKGEILKYMLLRGGIEFIERQNAKGDTPLVDALKKKDIDKCVLLLQAGAEFDAKTEVPLAKELKIKDEENQVLIVMKQRARLHQALDPSRLRCLSNLLENEYLFNSHSEHDKYNAKRTYQLGSYDFFDHKKNKENTLETRDFLLHQREELLSFLRHDTKITHEILETLVKSTAPYVFKMSESDFIAWLTTSDPTKRAKAAQTFNSTIDYYTKALRPMIEFYLARLLKPKDPDKFYADQAKYFTVKDFFLKAKTDCPLPTPVREIVLDYCKWVTKIPVVSCLLPDEPRPDFTYPKPEFPLYLFTKTEVKRLNESLANSRLCAFSELDNFRGEKNIKAPEKQWKPEQALRYLKKLKASYIQVIPHALAEPVKKSKETNTNMKI